MDSGKDTIAVPVGPDAMAHLEQRLLDAVGSAIRFVQADTDSMTLLEFERASWRMVMQIGQLLVALFLARRREQTQIVLECGMRVKNQHACRTIKTQYGPVSYGRSYLLRRNGGGWFPLDAALGVTGDSFSWRVTELVTRMATHVSYAAVQKLCLTLLGRSPSPSAIEQLVVGLGSRAAAFQETQEHLSGDGEVLVIEIDGKAAPFATEQELQARRQKHKHPACPCGCYRHTRRQRQRLRGTKPRKTRGNNSKNGRSATLAAMYTLQRGADGKLHGPINKKIWGQFGSRKDMMLWVRDQAIRRGFGPDSEKTVQILMDGERCLANVLKTLFPKAIFTLDLRHVEERLWKAGRQFHPDGSPELAAWVEPLNQLLVNGRITALLRRLQAVLNSIPRHGPGTKLKRTILAEQIRFITERRDMMRYDNYRRQDLVLATGIIEGACRHILGDRLDCSGMRWTPTGAESVLQLRCLEFNGDWNAFVNWAANQCQTELNLGRLPKIRLAPKTGDKQAA
jgi:hypothetical protein